MKSINKNFIYNIIYQLFTYLIPFLTIPYISRTLGVQNIGIYSYTNSIVSYFMLFSLLGISNYGTKMIAKKSTNKKECSKTFFSIYYLQFFLTFSMLLLYLLFVFFFAKNYQLIFFISTLSLISVFFDINWFFFGLEKFKITVSRNIFIKLISLIFLFLLVKTKEDLWIYTLIMSGSTLISQIYLWFYLKKEIVFCKVSISDVMQHVKECFILFIPVIAYSIYRIMDKTMIGAISGTYPLGLYENAEKVINIPISFITALGTIMLPYMAKKKKDAIKEKIGYSFQLCFCFIIPMMFGLLAIGKDFATIFFGSSFTESGVIIMLLCPGILASAIASVIRTNYLIPESKNNIYVASTLLGAFLNLGLNLILIPIYGVYGACFSTVVAEFSVMFYQLVRVRKEIPLMKIIDWLLPYLMKGSIMFVFVVLWSFLLPDIMIRLGIQILVAILLWFSFNYSFIQYEFLGKRREKNEKK